ncbi:unnamed protein product [Chilo suppressalis]|uniref:THAP-type domain-containing protein n=1 Tax=Chilo suppressalis TaxID=168631 RepID=A0ABN8BBV4_CHISP|nr:unnamed protein product [Chilo suppressalis]
MPSCAIVNCKNSTNTARAGRDKGNISFHRFPRDPKVKDKWIEATGNKDWFPTKHSRICSIHFNEYDFTETNKFRRLHTLAIPTIDVLKTSNNNEIIHQPTTSKENAPLNIPKKRNFVHKLILAQQTILEKNKQIKRLREQNRRKDKKILTLLAAREIDFIRYEDWPSSNPDLSPLDYKIWQHLEEKACSKSHPNLESLKTSLIKAAADIDVDLVRAAIDDWPRRLKACIQNQGGHFE